MNTAIDDFQIPVCVWCKRGTTPHWLVRRQFNFPSRRFYHAHSACIRNGKPVPRDPSENRARSYPSLAERLAQWNALADEFALLWTQCWSGFADARRWTLPTKR